MQEKINIIKGVAYARFSSEMQRDESIDAQLRAIKEYSRKNNIEIVSVFIDKAQSGTSSKRVEFQKMINESKKKKFNAIVVHKFDRFSRNRYDAITYKRDLRNLNIDVISVTEHIDNSPEGKMLESMLESMNEFYSQNLARETMKGLKENALQSKHTGGIPPLGFSINSEKKLIINNNEAVIVRIIFDMYSKGKSYNQILDFLNSNNYRTKNNNLFGKNSLHTILMNEKYIGTYVYNKIEKRRGTTRNSHKYKSDDDIIRIKDGCPKIIDDDTFQKVKRRFELRKRTNTEKTSHIFIFGGKIRCGECGSRYTSKVTHRSKNDLREYLYYGCCKNNNTRKCNNRLVRSEYLEEVIYSKILAALKNKDFCKKITNDIIYKYEQNLKQQFEAEKKLQETNEKIDNIISILSNHKNLILFDKLDELEKIKSSLECQIFCFNQMNIDELQAILFSNIEKIKTMDKKTFNIENVKHIEIEKEFIKSTITIFDEYSFEITIKRE